MITYGPLLHFIAQAAALAMLCKHSKMMQSSYLTTESVDFGHDIAPHDREVPSLCYFDAYNLLNQKLIT